MGVRKAVITHHKKFDHFNLTNVNSVDNTPQRSYSKKSFKWNILPVFTFFMSETFPTSPYHGVFFLLMVSYHSGLFIFSWSHIISWSDIACYRTSPRPTSNFRHLWNIVTLSNMFPTKTKSPSKSSFTSAITVNIFFLVNINLFYGDFFFRMYDMRRPFFS